MMKTELIEDTIEKLFVVEKISYMKGCIVLMALVDDTFTDDSDVYLCDPWSWSKKEYNEESNDWKFLEIIMEKVNDIFLDQKLTNGEVFDIIGNLFNTAVDNLQEEMPEVLHNKLCGDIARQGLNIY
jgi:hypothetical protein